MSRFLALAVVLVLGLSGLTYQAVPSPLDRLSAATRAVPMWHVGSFSHAQDNAHYWEAQQLEMVLGRLFRIPVKYEQLDKNYGENHYEYIVIEKSLGWSARLRVLAHEAGHLFMPWTVEGRSSESEMFAEAVAYLVCRKAGLDTIEASSHYLSQHKQALDVLVVYRAEIEYAAATLTP